MSTVADVLKGKGHEVWSVAPDATVYDALGRLAQRNIGALVVLERGKLVGIFSERDYARKIILVGKASKDTTVSDIMSRKLATVTPAHTVEQCMGLMVDKHIRHLPVLGGGELVGLVSIGDVVKALISHQRHVIEEQQRYIMGA